MDPRRNIPRTDELLLLADATSNLSTATLKALAHDVQAAARRGEISPEDVRDVFVARANQGATTLTAVINATGVVVHTNVGRAPLSPGAVEAMARAAGYVDVEMDLDAGVRSRERGKQATDALLAACPAAEDALVVNNGASALLLAAATFAEGGEMVISRGELIEIGAGFRLPELIESARVRLVEVGATNRTHPADYERAHEAKAILKVHPSNYRVEGFTASVSVAQLREIADAHGQTLIVDTGSGLLASDPLLPDEPDATTALKQGADVVLFSGDKLLGGPQAGVMLGTREAIAKMRKHPLARAVRIDKLRLAALEATMRLAHNPTHAYLHADLAVLKQRTEALAAKVASKVEGRVVAHDGRVGGGGAPGHPLPGYAVELDESLAAALRRHDPAILGRIHGGRLLIDLRCVPEDQDALVAAAIVEAAGEVHA
ncbi:L-seryl-tRNA(Sec) selenium transferase [Corynebacterium sp. HMSC29G08]|uniref:L-seryl-tRNA(Sec) selenium transferase n=1 Tax=Corynebacterium sp. HMSC29G08 TaxID=1581069 RepID=UPI0008A3A4BC|nr:L-seryl-tRNA(Sec) selenium transferase [Corynebacterium sp. HMSC29G08]OFT86291.1 L-seryl-tRNA(Sec) selenium transferase [Corynebacterium sp. HMSC29G08]